MNVMNEHIIWLSVNLNKTEIGENLKIIIQLTEELAGYEKSTVI